VRLCLNSGRLINPTVAILMHLFPNEGILIFLLERVTSSFVWSKSMAHGHRRRDNQTVHQKYYSQCTESNRKAY